MPDYCIKCGEADSNDPGKYVEFEPINGGKIYPELFVCDQCCIDYNVE